MVDKLMLDLSGDGRERRKIKYGFDFINSASVVEVFHGSKSIISN